MVRKASSRGCGAARSAITIMSRVHTSFDTRKRRRSVRTTGASATAIKFVTVGLALAAPPSVDFCGYWQRHKAA
jgi:hypothetical protein